MLTCQLDLDNSASRLLSLVILECVELTIKTVMAEVSLTHLVEIDFNSHPIWILLLVHSV